MGSPVKVQVLGALRTTEEKQDQLKHYWWLNGDIAEHIGMEFKEVFETCSDDLRLVFEHYIGDKNRKHLKSADLIKLLNVSCLFNT